MRANCALTCEEIFIFWSTNSAAITAATATATGFHFIGCPFELPTLARGERSERLLDHPATEAGHGRPKRQRGKRGNEHGQEQCALFAFHGIPHRPKSSSSSSLLRGAPCLRSVSICSFRPAISACSVSTRARSLALSSSRARNARALAERLISSPDADNCDSQNSHCTPRR